MEKRLIDRFTDDFESNMQDGLTHEETFRKAKEQFESVCGFTPYNNYKSYKSARSRDRNKTKNRFR